LAEIKVNVPEEVEKKFRKTAKIIYGEDKNAQDKAATEALAKLSEIDTYLYRKPKSPNSHK